MCGKVRWIWLIAKIIVLGNRSTISNSSNMCVILNVSPAVAQKTFDQHINRKYHYRYIFYIMQKNSRTILPLHKTNQPHYITLQYNRQHLPYITVLWPLYYITLHHITAYKYKENTSIAKEFVCHDWHKIAIIGLIGFYANVDVEICWLRNT